jgi:serine/threonine protein phosphatase PrpC
MSIASFNATNGTMRWIGVGNVEGLLLRSGANVHTTGQRDKGLVTRGGVVGYQIPRLREAEISVNPDDVLILTTDGIRPVSMEHLTLSDPPQQIADRILELHAKNTDDALVLVARYLGGAP